MFAWSPRDLDSYARHDSYMRRGAMLSFEILRIQERESFWPRVVKDVAEWLDATAVRGFDLDAGGAPVPIHDTGSRRLPPAAVEMEQELLVRSLARGRSLISNHPMLDDELRLLGDALERTGSVVHAVLLRAYQRSVGAVVVHWIGVPRPAFERRDGFFTYLENASLALALTLERETRRAELDELHRAAYTDALTGLPNHRALDRELDAAGESGLALVVLDFDGMREANTAFQNDYALGGDVLIRAFSGALGRLLRPGEFAARLHTAGDEFCVLLPGGDEAGAERRAGELEAALDGLEVPMSHRHVYGGASVGAAVRRGGEAPAETLSRASVAMHARKALRRERRACA
jgi:diguanylate cyclase (GGDEF)-like protein